MWFLYTEIAIVVFMFLGLWLIDIVQKQQEAYILQLDIINFSLKEISKSLKPVNLNFDEHCGTTVVKNGEVVYNDIEEGGDSANVENRTYVQTR